MDDNDNKDSESAATVQISFRKPSGKKSFRRKRDSDEEDGDGTDESGIQ